MPTRPVAAEAAQHLSEGKSYEMPSLRAVDLSYAGRLTEGHQVHAAIAEARVGDPIRIEEANGRWRMIDRRGRPLGRMAKAWTPRRGASILEASVGAVVRWRKSDNDPAYRDRIRREEWETILPEIVLGQS